MSLTGELYQGKYSVCETSGSTGYPFYMAYNRRESFKMNSAMSKNLKMKFVLNRPACYLFPFDKHMLSTCSAKEGLRKYPLMKKYTGGETLSQKTREHIENVFGCRMYSMYASTEASGIALDCDCGHMHLHNDSLIVEPVDENYNPVPVGEKSHKILITSLYERTVPLIRYEVSDKVTI